MKTKRVLSLLVCAALIFTLLPAAALASGTGSFVVTGDTSGYSYADGTLTFNTNAAGKTYTVSMASGVSSEMTDKIVVDGGTSDSPVSITLSSVHINRAWADDCAFTVKDSSVVSLMLRGDNVLRSGTAYAGLQVTVYNNGCAALSISEDGATPATDSLTAIGGYSGAGIGGSYYNDDDGWKWSCGTVTINGGTVTATGGIGGAGIGGGERGAGGTVTITGGTVTANGSYGGAGIGGGWGIGGTVTITGGTVTANGGYGGAGIGGGYYRSGGTVYISGGSVYAAGGHDAEAIGKGNDCTTGSGTLQNNSSDNTPVYLTAVTLSGITKETAVSAMNAAIDGTDYSYGVGEMKTDALGRLYLYLPEGDCTLHMTAGEYSYVAALTVDSTGTNTVTANDLSSTDITIDTAGTYVLTGSTAVNKIVVDGGTETDPVNITLDSVSVCLISNSLYPFDVKSGSFVNLTLLKDNTLLSDHTALHVPDGAALTISGSGSLAAASDLSDRKVCAGIGGSDKESCGSVTINGGTVTATGGARAAGIGGGNGGNGGTVMVNGGTVIAKCCDNSSEIDGAGIGGGYGGSGGTVIAECFSSPSSFSCGAGIGGGLNGDGGTVSISGGSVYASSDKGKAIGAGLDGSGDGTLQNDSSDKTPVSLTTVTLQGADGGVVGYASVSSLTASLNNSAYAYGAKGMQTDTDGRLYLYLPEDTATTAAQAAGNRYLGSVTTAADAAASQGALKFSSVSVVTPDDTESYTIISAAVTGGSISPSGSVSVADGGDKTYTITASDGYEIKDVMVDGVSVGAVGTYTFKNAKKTHTITASFAEKKTVNPFTDVKSSDWFYDNVLYVYKNGLMNGTVSDTFSPNGGMTRGMFVTVLYRLSGDTGSFIGSFTDVASGAWYESPIAWAAKSGIVGGVGDNKFAPNSGITREQLAVILYHYAKYKGYDVSIGEDTNILSYEDALSISEYAYSSLQWACGAGIINGNNGYLNPQSSATRAEVAAMLQRFVENVPG